MRGSNSHKKQAWGNCVRKTRRMVPFSATVVGIPQTTFCTSRLSKRYCKNFGCFLSREHPPSEHVRAKPIPSTVAGLRGSLTSLGLPTEISGRHSWTIAATTTRSSASCPGWGVGPTWNVLIYHTGVGDVCDTAAQSSLSIDKIALLYNLIAASCRFFLRAFCCFGVPTLAFREQARAVV